MLSTAEVQGVIKDAHTEFAKETPGDVKVTEAAMALLARLSMNAL